MHQFDVHQLDIVSAAPGFMLGAARLGAVTLGITQGPETDVRGQILSLDVTRSLSPEGFTITHEGDSCGANLRYRDTPDVLFDRPFKVRYRSQEMFAGFATFDKRSVSVNMKDPADPYKWSTSTNAVSARAAFNNRTVDVASKPEANAEGYLTSRISGLTVVVDDSVIHEFRTFRFPATTSTAEPRTAGEILRDVEVLLRCTAYLSDDMTVTLARPGYGGGVWELKDTGGPSYRGATLTRSYDFYNAVQVKPIGWDKPAPTAPAEGQEITEVPDIIYKRSLVAGAAEKLADVEVPCRWSLADAQTWAAAQPLRLASDEYVSSVDVGFDEALDPGTLPSQAVVWLQGRRYGPLPVLGVSVSADPLAMNYSLELGPTWYALGESADAPADPQVTWEDVGAGWVLHTVAGGKIDRWVGRYKVDGTWPTRYNDGTVLPYNILTPGQFSLPDGFTAHVTLWGVNASGVPLTPPYTMEVSL